MCDKRAFFQVFWWTPFFVIVFLVLDCAVVDFSLCLFTFRRVWLLSISTLNSLPLGALYMTLSPTFLPFIALPNGASGE